MKPSGLQVAGFTGQAQIVATLSRLGLTPTLLDIGASAGAPAQWQLFASISHYIGFDPDARDFADGDTSNSSNRFKRSSIIPKAISTEPRESIHFNLTESPYCSSVLEPDQEGIQDYYFANYLNVVQRVEAPAVTLDRALADLNVPRLDWLKSDTQGTDIRLYKSIGAPWRGSILAVDIEALTMPHYHEQDTLGDTHATLTAEGFICARLGANGMPPASRDTVRSLYPALSDRRAAKHAERVLHTGVGWLDLRYLRHPAHLVESGGTPDQLALLWAFAHSSDLPALALEVLSHLSRIAPNYPEYANMLDTTRGILDAALRPLLLPRWRRALNKLTDIRRLIAAWRAI